MAVDVAQNKSHADLERTFEVLQAQISAARKELSLGGKVSKESAEFQQSLQQLAGNKAWSVLCW